MDECAEVVERPGLRWSAGAPDPVVLASERRCLIAFHGPDVEGEEDVRVAEARRCLAVRCGVPNDEALPGHPLWGKGLRYYAAHEVVGSRWLAEVRRTEAAHPRAERPVPYPWARHFLLAFHDSCVEMLAEDVVVRAERYDSLAAAVAAAAAEVAAGE